MKTIKLGKKPTPQSRPSLCTLSPLFSFTPLLVPFPSTLRPAESSNQVWIRTPWGAGERGKWNLEASLPVGGWARCSPSPSHLCEEPHGEAACVPDAGPQLYAADSWELRMAEEGWAQPGHPPGSPSRLAVLGAQHASEETPLTTLGSPAQRLDPPKKDLELRGPGALHSSSGEG